MVVPKKRTSILKKKNPSILDPIQNNDEINLSNKYKLIEKVIIDKRVFNHFKTTTEDVLKTTNYNVLRAKWTYI